MISERTIKRLKQSNVSVDGDKTKVRVNELWKSASKSQKNAVEEEAGISRATIYRVYKTGSISAKLVVPMAQNFNVDPNYLTGKSNEASTCSDELLIEFLTELGYTKIMTTEAQKGKRRGAKQKTEPAGTEAAPVANDVYDTAQLAAGDLTLADLHLLMQSLLLREKAGVADAVDKAAKLRALLLS